MPLPGLPCRATAPPKRVFRLSVPSPAVTVARTARCAATRPQQKSGAASGGALCGDRPAAPCSPPAGNGAL